MIRLLLAMAYISFMVATSWRLFEVGAWPLPACALVACTLPVGYCAYVWKVAGELE